MAATFFNIPASQIIQFLEERSFQRIDLPGTNEVVFGRVYSHFVEGQWAIPLTLRVYTTIELGQVRGRGADAIRVLVVAALPDNKIVPIGSTKRVHRVENWKENLAQRLNNWRELLQPECPVCAAPMRLITMRQAQAKALQNQFYGCIRYPHCRGTRNKE